jgi:hypothetical protein
MALPTPVRQQAARSILSNLMAYPAATYAIHYACQSFHLGEQLQSPRVTAIGLRSLAGGQVVSFSIFEEVELARIPRAQAVRCLDLLERQLLERFSRFVRGCRHARFLHWNMRDAHYGFAALEHRLKVLGGCPDTVPEHNRFDLAGLITDVYGDEYVEERAKLESLAKLNGLSLGGFLSGADEARAFEAGRYRDVLSSTLCKVRLIAEFARRAHDRTLATRTSWWSRNGGIIRMTIRKVLDNPMISLAASGVGIIVGLLKAFGYLIAR